MRIILLLLLISCTSKIQSTAKQSWNIILSEKVDPKKVHESLIILDLFMNDASTITELRNKDTKVICYINSGAIETYRPDYKDFPKTAIGKAMGSYPDEHYINLKSAEVLEFMKRRLTLAKEKNCNGIMLDNLNGDVHAIAGFNVGLDDLYVYTSNLIHHSNDIGLLAGVNNSITQIRRLAPQLDFAVNEQCQEFNECNLYDGLNIPIYEIEYRKCVKNNLNVIKKNLKLDSKKEECL